MPKILTAYFSPGGSTREIAQNLSAALGSDLYEIKPAVPYTEADLNWMDKNARSTIEMKDKNSRPLIIDDDAKISEYDIILLGFPIWWYIAPTIINTFLEKYNFANKKIILFGTSGGSGFGRTVENLIPSIHQSAEIVEGEIWVQGRFSKNPGPEELKDWFKNLNLNWKH